MSDERPMTYGEKAVGLDFNPSGDETVAKLKTLYAEIIDICHSTPHQNGGEHARLYDIAIASAQQAQMWAVKAVTWKD